MSDATTCLDQHLIWDEGIVAVQFGPSSADDLLPWRAGCREAPHPIRDALDNLACCALGVSHNRIPDRVALTAIPSKALAYGAGTEQRIGIDGCERAPIQRIGAERGYQMVIARARPDEAPQPSPTRGRSCGPPQKRPMPSHPLDRDSAHASEPFV
jgi:hypothetical protein